MLDLVEMHKVNVNSETGVASGVIMAEELDTFVFNDIYNYVSDYIYCCLLEEDKESDFGRYTIAGNFILPLDEGFIKGKLLSINSTYYVLIHESPFTRLVSPKDYSIDNRFINCGDLSSGDTHLGIETYAFPLQLHNFEY